MSLSDGSVKRSALLFVEGYDSAAGETCVIIAFKTTDWPALSELINRTNDDPRRMNEDASTLRERGQCVRLDYLFDLIQQKKHLILTGHSQGN